jgi:FkbM family methyltransferase
MNIQDYINEEAQHLNLLSLLFKDTPPKIFIEIGACEGEDSIRYINKFPSIFLYAVEALPDNAVLIRSNIPESSASRFQLIESAITEFDGPCEFHVSSGHPDGIPKSSSWNYGNKSSSLLPPAMLMGHIHKWLKFNKKIIINGISLPTLFSKIPFEVIDFLHMDVQGAELGILRGGENVLHKIRCLWVEVSEKKIYQYQPSALDIEKFMSKNGFLKVIDTLKDGFGDHFYINKSRFLFNLI